MSFQRSHDQQVPLAYRNHNGAYLPPLDTALRGPLPSTLRMAPMHALASAHGAYPSSMPASPLPSPVMTDSDSSSAVYSPATSRRPSMSISTVSAVRPSKTRARKSSRATAIRTSPPRNLLDNADSQRCGTCGKAWCSHIEKARKERHNRKAQGERLQDAEDMLQILGNFSSHHLQSPGNHNAAGLDITKNEVLDWVVCWAAWKMQEEYENALRADRVAQWQNETQQEVTRRCAEGRPLTGTWLVEADEGPSCDHERHNKTCIVHGAADWSQCRKSRRQASFAAQMRKFVANRVNKSTPRVSPRL